MVRVAREGWLVSDAHLGGGMNECDKPTDRSRFGGARMRVRDKSEYKQSDAPSYIHNQRKGLFE
jgi:hypothetical protein